MFNFNPAFPNATTEQQWNQFRLYRLDQFNLSNWTRMDDCDLPEDIKQKVFEYRKLLKDAPNLYERVEDIEFPGYMALRDYKIVFVAEPYKAQPIVLDV